MAKSSGVFVACIVDITACLARGCVTELPGRNTQRTKTINTASDVIPYFTRCYAKSQMFCLGKKPSALSHIESPTQRDWQTYLNGCAGKNPVLEAYKYLNYLNLPTVKTYSQAARHFGVSRQRVCQYVGLVTRLPERFVEWLSRVDSPRLLKYFTERRLRPLVRIKDKARQWEIARRMIAEVHLGGVITSDPVLV